MVDIVHLGDALSVLEGLLVGDSELGIDAPSPLLGLGLGVDITESITLVDGLFLGRPLMDADFLVDKKVVVTSPTSVNAGGDTATETYANDTVHTDLSMKLPLTDRTTDQKAARNGALKLDNQIRGTLCSLDVEQLGLKFTWVRSSNRVVLDTGTAGTPPYGSARFLVVTSIYKMTRCESLTGGPS